MTQEEITEKLESYQKQMEDYNLQIETLSRDENISDPDKEMQFHYLMGKIDIISEEIENLISKLE